MKAPDDVKTPLQYLAQVPEGRREDLTKLHQLICETVPNLKPTICYGMIGYGVVPYESKSGCKGEAPLVALANQVKYMSLYVGYLESGGSVALAKDRLGKVSVGKSCIRFTKLENLNVEVAMEFVKRAGDGTR